MSAPKVMCSRCCGFWSFTRTGGGSICITSGSSRLSTIEARLAKNAGLGRSIGVDVTVPVEVILRDVQHRGGRRFKASHAIELKAGKLQHPGLGQCVRVDMTCQGVEQCGANVAGHRHGLASTLHQLPGERCDRGFAIGASDGQHARCVAGAGCAGRPAGCSVQGHLAARDQANRLGCLDHQGERRAGLRPGERYTACRPLPSTSDCIEGPATNRTCGSSCCSKANCGGASRVSATVTWAPQFARTSGPWPGPKRPDPAPARFWPCMGAHAFPRTPLRLQFSGLRFSHRKVIDHGSRRPRPHRSRGPRQKSGRQIGSGLGRRNSGRHVVVKHRHAGRGLCYRLGTCCRRLTRAGLQIVGRGWVRCRLFIRGIRHGALCRGLYGLAGRPALSAASLAAGIS